MLVEFPQRIFSLMRVLGDVFFTYLGSLSRERLLENLDSSGAGLWRVEEPAFFFMSLRSFFFVVQSCDTSGRANNFESLCWSSMLKMQCVVL